MKKIEWFYNLLFYTIYKWDLYIGSLLVYIFSLKWYKYLISSRRLYYDDKFHIDSSYSYMSVNNATRVFAAAALFSTINIVNVIVFALKIGLHFSINNVLTAIFLFSIITTIIQGYYFILKNKKYKAYFDLFNSIPKERRIRNSIIANFTIILNFCLFFLGLLIYT